MSSTRTLYQMKISKIIDHTPNVRELIIQSTNAEGFHFKAGQFVMLHVPQPDKPALRAYSIASDDRNHAGFRLLFKYVDKGVASTYVWGLKGDETLTMTGPFGRVFFKEPPTEQIIFLNTGTGISQHICYLNSKKELFPDLKYKMLFGLRNESEIYLLNELEELKKTLKNFSYDVVLSQPAADWKGKKGYIQHFLSDFDYKTLDSTFYLCGNGNMIKEVKQKLIEQDGIDKTKILTEAFD